MLDVSKIMRSKIPQATSLVTTQPQKTSYQQFFSEPIKQEWKLGDEPTNYGQALATINNMAKTDQVGALEKLNLLNQYRTQPGNKWYDPYASATNKDVETLKSYGFDPAELTYDWFNANREWQGYLRYNGTTNTPSKPTKKSSEQEKMAYSLHQFQKSMDATNAAKNEWAAAQDEINYWVNRKDLNLSDDDIIDLVFNSGKYSTLNKMDSTRYNGSPLELNEAIDYNPDSVRGVIWAARNAGGTGNIRQDIANYYSKTGNIWRENTSLSAKLNKGNLETYSPYEVGMTGKDSNEAGAYFGVSSFAPGDVEALRSKVDWNDATSVKMFQKVMDAEQTTLKAEEELKLFNTAFENKMKRGFASQEDADKWIEEQLNSGAYNTLVKMDNGILKGDPVNTTRAVPYSKQMYQKAAAESIANPKKNGADVLASCGIPVSDAEKSTTKVENENVSTSFDAMAKFLTEGEKDYINTIPGVEYNTLTAAFDGVKKGAETNLGNVARKQYNNVNGEYGKTVLEAIPVVAQYEKYKDAATRLNNKIIDFEQAHKADMLAAAEVEPEANVKLSDGTMAHLVYNQGTNQYELESLSNDTEAARAEAQQIIDKGNSRLAQRLEQIDLYGNASPEFKAELEQIAKDKEQLRVLYDWLGEHTQEYDVANRAVTNEKMRRDAIGEIAAHSAGTEYDPTIADSVIDYAGALYQYEAPPADGFTLIEESAGKSMDDIAKSVAENNANIKDIQFVLSALGDYVPEELKNKANGLIADMERQNRVYNDYALMLDPNFAKYVKAGEDWNTIYNPDDSPVGGESKNWFAMLTPEERNIYFALVGKYQGYEEADKFYTDIRDELIQRQQNKIEGVVQKNAEGGAFSRAMSEAGAILLAPLNTLMNTAYAAGVALGYDEAEMKVAKTTSHISQGQHSANINELKKIYGEDTALGKFLTGAYEIIFNRGNSLMNAITWGKLMPQFAGDGKIASFFNDVISATPIALSAASDALESAIDRGANPTQQAIIFASTLMAESWTEGIEFGHIEKAGKTLLTKEGITTFLKGYLPEAFSEVLGESANDLIENAADNWVSFINNPDYQNQHDLAVKAAMAEDDTLTPEQAEALVHQAEVDGVLHTAIISFFSPGADVISMAGNTLTTYYQYAKEAHEYNQNATGKHAKQKSIRDIRLEHEAAEAAAAEANNNPQPVQQTVPAPAQETTEQPAQQQTSPVFGPDASRARSYAKAMNEYDANIILLEEAATANATTQAAAIASAIDTGNKFVAQGAAAKLNIGMVQAMMLAGRQMNVNMQTLAQGLQYAALGNGECAKILKEGVANGLSTTDMAVQLATAAQIDATNQAVQQGVAAGTHDARVHEEFKRLMADLETKAKSKPTNANEAMERLTADRAVKAKKAIDDARALTKSKEEALEQKQNELIAAQNGIKEAAYEVADNPNTNGNHLTAALDKMASAAAVVEEYKQALENARQHQQEVESENLKLAEETTANLRQQAEDSIREQEAAELQAKQEAEAQAAAEAQAQAQAEQQQMEIANENRLDADAFIEQNHPNATEEQKEEIRRQFNEIKEQMGMNADAHISRMQFEKRLAKRFNLDVKHVDSVNVNGKEFSLFNARINPETGELLVTKNATQADMFYAILVHEITHLAEQNETGYADLANAVLQMAYGEGVTFDGILSQMENGDVSSRLAQDILAKKGLYDKQLDGNHTNKQMLQEIIADEVGKVISGDVNALNNLVAEKPSLAKRILDGIRNFLKNMVGIKSPAVTQAQQIADMLTAALEGNTVGSYQATGTQSSQNTDSKEWWRSIDVTDKAWQQKNIEAYNRKQKIKEQMLNDVIAKNGWTIKEGTWGNMSDDFSTHQEVFDGNGKSLGRYGNYYISGPNEYAKQVLESAGLVGERGNYSVPVQNAESNVKYSLPSDEDYLAAVESGDMETAQQMVDEAAESSGYTREVYHGTGNEPFNVFGYGKAGIYTTDSKEVAQTYGKNVMKLYGKQGTNVLTINADGAWHARIPAELVDFIDLSEYPFYKDKEALSTNDITNLAFNRGGYDVVVIENVADDFSVFGNQSNVVGTDIVYKDSNQIKSSAPVTYDDNGNPIPLSQRFNEQNNDIRYSLPSEGTLKQQIQQWLADNGLENANLSEAEARTLMNRLPNDAKEGNGIRQWAVKGAQASDELDQAAKNYLLHNKFYMRQSNAENLAKGLQWIHSNATEDDRTGYHHSLEIVMNENFNYASTDGQARMIAMIGMAAAIKDTYGQVALADAFNHQGTDMGRAFQLRNLWRLMTPEGRKLSLKNVVDKLNIELQTKGKEGDLKLSDWIYEAAGMAEDEGEFDRIRTAAMQELAEQLPANWKDRLRSFRMFCMLANPRTHIRNLLGNMLFMPAVSIKNKLGAVAELGLKQGDRTKTLALRVDSDIRAFAREDAKNRKDELTGDSRWKEGDSVKREQKPFTGKMKWLQAAIDWNSNKLEAEDWLFLRGHYARALGGWIQANGYTVADMKNHPEWLEKGRAYAQNEAQKATYRDFNAVANKLNQLSREGGFVGFLVDATLPFKKTPANIVKRGLEYSIIGLGKSLSTDLYHLHQYNEAKKNGAEIMPEKAISPNEFIDHFCAGLTGTAVMALGAFLSSIGWITVGLDDDDDKFEKAKGGQEYALKVKIGDDDVTYTLDWAAPMCMPFFVGAQIYEQLVAEDHSLTFADIVNDISSIAEPVFNLSMLDGVNSLLRTSNYDNATEIMQIVGKIASNYATSYVPALFGTATRIADDYRRKAFVKSGEGTGLMGTWRYAWEQTENKIYWAAQTNIPYRNIWGEPEGDSPVERVIENLVSPGYKSTLRKDPIIDEMERLYSSEDVADTRKSALIPKLPAGKAGGEALEPEQYDQFTVERGQTAKKVLSELLNSYFYKTATDNERAIMIGEAWDYATQIGSNKVVGTKLESWVANSRTNPVQGIINRQKNRTISDAKKDWKAEAIKAVQKEDYEALDVCIEALNELGVSRDSVKTAIGNAYKPAYIEAYQTGNRQKMIEIESILDLTGLGFDKVNKKGMDTYDQWIADMNKQIAEDEEDF